MKLLFDQNLSHRLVDDLTDLFPGSMHVRQIGLDNADDVALWNFAAKFGFTIVSKDTDFQQRSFLFGHPPKVVWIALANATTSEIVELIRMRYQEVVEFHNDSTAAYLAVF